MEEGNALSNYVQLHYNSVEGAWKDEECAANELWFILKAMELFATKLEERLKKHEEQEERKNKKRKTVPTE